MKEQKSTIKIASKWMCGEAKGTLGIIALVIMVGMVCLTVAWT